MRRNSDCTKKLRADFEFDPKTAEKSQNFEKEESITESSWHDESQESVVHLGGKKAQCDVNDVKCVLSVTRLEGYRECSG